MTQILQGYLFDVKVVGTTAYLIVVDKNFENPIVLKDEFYPEVYLYSKKSGEIKRIARNLIRRKLAKVAEFVYRTEFLSRKRIPVLRLRALNYRKLCEYLKGLPVHIEVFNTDIQPALYYMIKKAIFPTAWVKIETKDSSVVSINTSDSRYDTEYQSPSFRVLRMWTKGSPFLPVGPGVNLIVSFENTEHRFETDSPEEVLQGLKHIFHTYDPHIILTKGGDSYILPVLFDWQRTLGIDISLDRVSSPYQHFRIKPRKRKGSSYFSYGRMYYRYQPVYLFGRIHIDEINSFFYSETGIEGIIEVSRLSRMPIDVISRTTIGTAMTALQYDYAIRNNILIPGRKAIAEEFRSADELLVADKGGLIFMPPPGCHRNVHEIDFSQMYPSIMVKYNISPETIRTDGGDIIVPEAGYGIDMSFQGIVPSVLAPVLKKRLKYKKTAKQNPIYDKRQNAIKWILVTCFGYLGYKNARFGRIEAHEAVTAFGRETLLQAKEITEENGYRVLHGQTDSLWIVREDENALPVNELCKKITEETGIIMHHEGTYEWIVFAWSKTHPGISAINKYFGKFSDGRIKVRGLMLRKMDTPAFIKTAQKKMLEKLAELGITEKGKQAVLSIFEEYRDALHQGKIPLAELVIYRRVSKPVEKYKVETDLSVVLNLMNEKGIEISPGETVGYILSEGQYRAVPVGFSPVQIDFDRYEELLKRALEEVLTPFLDTKEQF